MPVQVIFPVSLPMDMLPFMRALTRPDKLAKMRDLKGTSSPAEVSGHVSLQRAERLLAVKPVLIPIASLTVK